MRSFHSLPNNVWRSQVYPHLGARNLASLSRASKQRHTNVSNYGRFRSMESTSRIVDAAATKLMFALTRGMATWDRMRRHPNPDEHQVLSRRVNLSAIIPTLSYSFDWWNPAQPRSAKCNVFMHWGPSVPNRPRAGFRVVFPYATIRGRKLRIKWPPAKMFDHNVLRKPVSAFDKAIHALALRIMKRAVQLYNERPVVSG